MLSLNQRQALNESVAGRSVGNPPSVSRKWHCRAPCDSCRVQPNEKKPVCGETLTNLAEGELLPGRASKPQVQTQPAEIDPFYLLACYIEWEQTEDPGAGWELISAAQNPHSETRAHARALLANSCHIGSMGSNTTSDRINSRRRSVTESEMNTPYGLDIIENCTECTHINPGFFCSLSDPALSALNEISHKSTLPAGAILFVEGQAPRGMFILCSGKVNLSTTSREGKILILKTALPGESLGLSAAISGTGYEMTAETATPCQLNFIDRKHFLELLQSHSETGFHAAQALSRARRSRL